MGHPHRQVGAASAGLEILGVRGAAQLEAVHRPSASDQAPLAGRGEDGRAWQLAAIVELPAVPTLIAGRVEEIRLQAALDEKLTKVVGENPELAAHGSASGELVSLDPVDNRVSGDQAESSRLPCGQACLSMAHGGR